MKVVTTHPLLLYTLHHDTDAHITAAHIFLSSTTSHLKFSRTTTIRNNENSCRRHPVRQPDRPQKIPPRQKNPKPSICRSQKPNSSQISANRQVQHSSHPHPTQYAPRSHLHPTADARIADSAFRDECSQGSPACALCARIFLTLCDSISVFFYFTPTTHSTRFLSRSCRYSVSIM